jgi:GNAT superfamily N-acetyltransferase
MAIPAPDPHLQIVVETGPARLADIAALSDAVIGPHEDMSRTEYYAWLYGGSPAGPAVQASALLDGTMVAHYAVVPVTWQTTDGDRVAGLGVNALTRRDAQGRGLFARLVSAADRAAAERGINPTFVVPGPESEPWYRTVLRYAPCGDLGLFVRPARLSRLAAYAPGKLRFARPLAPVADLVLRPVASLWRARAGRSGADLREVTGFGPEFDDLWQRARVGWQLGAARDTTFLNWRFHVPTRTYRVMGAWFNGRLAASVVFRAKRTHHMPDLALASIVDLVAEPTPDGDRMAALLVAEAVFALAKEGADASICQMQPDFRLAAALMRNGFVRIPGRHAGFRPVVARGLEAAPTGTGVHFTGADYDMG